MSRKAVSERDLVVDVEKVKEAMRQAARQAVRMHKLTGKPLVFQEHGEIVWVPASELELGEEEGDRPLRIYPY